MRRGHLLRPALWLLAAACAASVPSVSSAPALRGGDALDALDRVTDVVGKELDELDHLVAGEREHPGARFSAIQTGLTAMPDLTVLKVRSATGRHPFLLTHTRLTHTRLTDSCRRPCSEAAISSWKRARARCRKSTPRGSSPG